MTYTVALVGRPNVGKSTLFNRLLGHQHSIVEKTPGVTRDRVEAPCTWLGKNFMLVDTGGFVEGARPILEKKILQQANEAIHRADLILFVVDAKQGIVHEDEALAQYLRQAERKKPILVVANKIDETYQENQKAEFYALGLDEPFSISALHGKGIGDLLDEILRRAGESLEASPEPAFTFCLAGRPNVGKSSLVNAILGEQRTIVHEEPGTTRDVVDTIFLFEGQPVAIADTAGLRKRAKATESVEFFSRTRTIKAIRRSDVALLVLEAPSGVTAQDKKIAAEIHEAGTGMIILANKWDLLEGDDRKVYRHFKEHVEHQLPFVHYAPVLPTSVVTGQGIQEILPCVSRAFLNWQQTMETQTLRKVLNEAFFLAPPPSAKGKKFRLKSVTCAQNSPPTIVLKSFSAVNLPSSYLRFLEGKIRQVFNLEGTPLRIRVQHPAQARPGRNS